VTVRTVLAEDSTIARLTIAADYDSAKDSRASIEGQIRQALILEASFHGLLEIDYKETHRVNTPNGCIVTFSRAYDAVIEAEKATEPQVSEAHAWLKAHAEEQDFEAWNQGEGNAPWNAETFHSIPGLKAGLRASDNHFFSKGAMQVFHSKVESGMLGQRFFITSEYMDDPAEKRYTLRWAYRTPAGSLAITELVFQGFDTLQDAKAGALILQALTAEVNS